LARYITKANCSLRIEVVRIGTLEKKVWIDALDYWYSEIFIRIGFNSLK